MKRFTIAALLAALSLSTSAPPAAAAVTIGQLAPTTPVSACNPSIDRIQPTVTSGNAFVIPGNGAITSWSHNASTVAGQLVTFKVFRNVSGLTYTAVGHEGPHLLTPSALNTFSGLNIPVKPGDVIGTNAEPSTPNYGCSFSVTGDSHRFRFGNLADGEPGTFGNTDSDTRLNLTAVFVPSNAFSLGDVDRNKKKGTAKLTLNIPNPGELVVSGKGLRKREKSPDASGDVVLKIKAKKSKLDRLEENGKVKVKPKITFTPTGGDPNTQQTKLKLKKR